jgi:hypothetical protein
MSLSSPSLDPAAVGWATQSGRAHMAARPIAWARKRLFADSRRTIQISLGLLWLLDGALQLQSFMYGGGFIAALKATGAGQPPWVTDTVNWAANTMQSHQAPLNTLFALVQIWIGAGLVNRRTVKLALAVSLAWSLLVWWFGEGFGMLFMSMSSPLSGAPGAALLYLMVALVVWPGERPGGLLGVRGAKLTWAALWLVMAWLWLGPAGSSPNAVSDALNGAPSGIAWLTQVQEWLATASRGHGLPIGLTLAAVSAAIGIAVARNWHARAFLALSVFINLTFWIVGQGFGGMFTGAATDPNAAPLFCLLAAAVYELMLAGARRSAPDTQPLDLSPAQR